MSNKEVTIYFEQGTFACHIVPEEDAETIVNAISGKRSVLFAPLNWTTNEPTSERIMVMPDKVLYVKVTDQLPF